VGRENTSPANDLTRTDLASAKARSIRDEARTEGRTNPPECPGHVRRRALVPPQWRPYHRVSIERSCRHTSARTMSGSWSRGRCRLASARRAMKGAPEPSDEGSGLEPTAADLVDDLAAVGASRGWAPPLRPWAPPP